jgi:hypothetical protein
MKKMKIETLISKELEEGSTFQIIAHELWNDGEGWSVNQSWYMARSSTKEEALIHCRGRWEVFKENYLPRARVMDITFDGDDEVIYINAESIPFLEIRINK